jgi:hypothetical protein
MHQFLTGGLGRVALRVLVIAIVAFVGRVVWASRFQGPPQ